MLYILHTRSRISSVEMVSGKAFTIRQCRFWFIARLTCSLPLGQGWQLNVVFPQVHPVDIVLLCPPSVPGGLVGVVVGKIVFQKGTVNIR
jgi:hypothetical protein